VTEAADPASPPPRRPRRAAKPRREEVLDAVVGVISERGIESTRFTDISRAVGVAVSTLQYWFGSREDMLVEAFLHMNRRDVDRIQEISKLDADPWRRLEHLIRFDLGLGEEPRTVDRRSWLEFWSSAVRDEELREESKRVYAWWRQPFLTAITEGTERGIFEPATSPDAIATGIVIALDGATVPMLLDHDYFDAAAFADEFLAGLAVTLRYDPAA
jgi:AcrR family transcriptional regulator